MGYEYKHVCLSSSLHQQPGLNVFLNNYAKDGWRVISTLPPKREMECDYTWEFILERIATRECGSSDLTPYELKCLNEGTLEKCRICNKPIHGDKRVGSFTDEPYHASCYDQRKKA